MDSLTIDDYGLCISCNRQREKHFLNDISICSWCLLTKLTITHNPLIETSHQ